MAVKIVPFDALGDCDLDVDTVYLGGSAGNVGDDPLSRILPCGNLGGFRQVGKQDSLKAVVLFSTLSDRDWPDSLDQFTGRFVYYGDNKKPGHGLHDTPLNLSPQF